MLSSEKMEYNDIADFFADHCIVRSVRGKYETQERFDSVEVEVVGSDLCIKP